MRIALHGHHKGDTPFSIFGTKAGAGARREFIGTEKPEDERELRLALFQDVTGALPKNAAWAAFGRAAAADRKAWAAHRKAVAAPGEAAAADRKAWAAYRKAEAARGAAEAAYLASFDVEAFHRQHCHPRCPWDGKTIFSRGTGIEALDEVTA